MRVIAGEFRGRHLIAPSGDVTRPITDRVKQSLFDILTPLLPDSRVADCFAGTGSMGLECLSRGSAFVDFFESDRSALDRFRQNISVLRIAERCRVHPGDLFGWFENSANAPAADARINILFLDPPYRFVREQPESLRHLAGVLCSRFLASEGTVIFRHDSQDELELPPLQCIDRREYGGMTVEFLTSRDADASSTER